MQKSVIIVGGGTGNRMKSDIPKQFLEIEGKPILMHTIEKFYFFNKSINIIVVLPDNQLNYWQSLVSKFDFKIQITIALGGETRFHSVKNGLAFVNEGIVGIHDAVRPLVSLSTIENAYKLAEQKGNAIPVISVNESIRLISEDSSKHIDRNLVKIVQTPQCFDYEVIKKAYQQEYNTLFTDDASVVEKSEVKIYLSEGNPENIKITTPMDLKFANIIAK